MGAEAQLVIASSNFQLADTMFDSEFNSKEINFSSKANVSPPALQFFEHVTSVFKVQPRSTQISKLKSNWSKLNKERVEKLIATGLMQPAGLEKIEWAKQNGTWDALNEVEQLLVPADMQKALDGNPTALGHWGNFSRSVRRGILEWILNAKREETRAKRIEETVRLAAQNIKANQYERK
jgi:uncharacterized protein YdeI (YjbR/CyaY-like superfamily)